MGTSGAESFPAEEEPAGFEYKVDVRAWETFCNIMRGYGISLREGDRILTFRSEIRVDMKRLKEKGLLWSYSVAKVIMRKEVVETG
jgi:hypothetical protein